MDEQPLQFDVQQQVTVRSYTDFSYEGALTAILYDIEILGKLDPYESLRIEAHRVGNRVVATVVSEGRVS